MTENLVTTEWLAEHLTDPNLRIVDIRGMVKPIGSPAPRYLAMRPAYDDAHIPGAVFVDWTRDIVDVNDKVPVQIAKPEHFASTMSSLGIGGDTLVIAYDDQKQGFATRFAWALRYHGHDNVRVLDGGFAKWVAENRPTAALPTKPQTAAFIPHVRPELRATAADVEAAIARGALIIDARPAAQFAGKESVAARSGHIPTAKSVPHGTLIDEKGVFRSPADIAKAMSGVDYANAKEIVTYCNGGVMCNIVRTALSMLGRDDVAVYDGSWNEWGNDPSRPIET